MIFEVSSNELQRNLQVAGGAIDANPVMPVLEDFLFELTNNELTISATNLEVTIISFLTVAGSEDGIVAVPARILLETLKALPDHPIRFQMKKQDFSILLTSAYGEYKLSGDNPEDYPETPEKLNTNDIEISADVFSKAINNTVFAASSDELKHAMMGVLMELDFNKIIFVATDAHKLVKYTVGGISSDVGESIVMPKKGLNVFKNALSISDEEKCQVSFNSNNIFFKIGDTIVISRLLDAKYPDYNSVIPINNDKKISINRLDFLNSLKRLVIYSSKSTNQANFTFEENKMVILAQDLDFSNEATEEVSCRYEGEKITIGFNAKFLFDMLGVISSKEVILEVSSPNKAGLLYPDPQEGQEKLLMLLMPVMMNH